MSKNIPGKNIKSASILRKKYQPNLENYSGHEKQKVLLKTTSECVYPQRRRTSIKKLWNWWRLIHYGKSGSQSEVRYNILSPVHFFFSFYCHVSFSSFWRRSRDIRGRSGVTAGWVARSRPLSFSSRPNNKNINNKAIITTADALHHGNPRKEKVILLLTVGIRFFYTVKMSTFWGQKAA